MKVIDLLEKWSVNNISYIDVYDEDKKELCIISCPERWREFLTEKVLNSELVTFSNRISEACGLVIYIKDEETVSTRKYFEKHDDDVADSLAFAVRELNKVTVQHKPFMNEIEDIIKNNPDTVIQVTFGDSKICVMVYSNHLRDTEFKNLSPHASVEDILDVIKDLIKEEDK